MLESKRRYILHTLGTAPPSDGFGVGPDDEQREFTIFGREDRSIALSRVGDDVVELGGQFYR